MSTICFALVGTRMDCTFSCAKRSSVRVGRRLGWVEGCDGDEGGLAREAKILERGREKMGWPLEEICLSADPGRITAGGGPPERPLSFVLLWGGSVRTDSKRRILAELLAFAIFKGWEKREEAEAPKWSPPVPGRGDVNATSDLARQARYSRRAKRRAVARRSCRAERVSGGRRFPFLKISLLPACTAFRFTFGGPQRREKGWRREL